MRILSAFLLLSFVCRSANGCGGFFCWPQQPIIQVGERIAFGIKENANGADRDITMAVQINYSGPSDKFSWILPVMANPDISVGSDLMFTGLFDASRPQFDLRIDNNGGSTCAAGRFDDEMPCAFMAMADGGGLGASPNAAIVVKEGSVGPFDYIVLEPAKKSPGLSVFKWLHENGYDQPEEAFGLIDYYATQGQLFVALKLTKNSDAGDIQPVILKYTMPGDMKDVACVPIQLTGIAADPNMPIQIFILSDDNMQAFPSNYLSVKLDDTQANWLGCRGNQNCFLNDMRDRFAAFLAEERVGGHAFLTEYAGSNSINANAIDLNIDVNELLKSTTIGEYVTVLSRANVPSLPFVNSILDDYIPLEFAEDRSWCANSEILEMSQFCIDASLNQEFDVAALTSELKTRVFDPAKDAQAWVSSHTYMTRMYGQLSPDQMNKDPFFGFNNNLPNVSNVHEAFAVPACNSETGDVEGLKITVESGESVIEPANYICGQWQPTNRPPPLPTPGLLPQSISVSTATEVAAIGYMGETSRILLRSNETGKFSADEVQSIIDFMDLRVPNQTVPSFDTSLVSNVTALIESLEDSGNDVIQNDIDKEKDEVVDKSDDEDEVVDKSEDEANSTESGSDGNEDSGESEVNNIEDTSNTVSSLYKYQMDAAKIAFIAVVSILAALNL